MLSLPSPVKIFLCAQPVDLRRSFDGLASIARDGLGEDPLSGHWFVFRNRRGDRIKILMWDRDGLLLVYKKLKADYPHSGPFTEFAGSGHNLVDRPAAAGGMD
jgi:transposase